MNFLSTTAFWFAAVIPVVVLFYLLKRKRVMKVVSSTLLWQKFLAETQANAPFQKLRHNWLLVLQILMLILAILALSRPYFASRTREGSLRVIILDASASMQSTDETPNRFEKARSEALKWIDDLRDQDQMVILQSSGRTEVKQSASGNKAALRRALQSCSVTDSPSRLVDALTLAETLVRDRVGAEVHLFSDGAVGSLSEFENKALNLVYHKVGKRNNNVAVTALDIKANPENPKQRAIYASVFNYSSNVFNSQVELAFNDQLVDSRPVEIGPGQSLPVVFLAPQAEDGNFTVAVPVEDDLKVDNKATLRSLLPQPLKVLMVTGGNPYLQKVLKAMPSVALTTVNGPPGDTKNFDLVVLDGQSPADWPDQNVLAVHAVHTNLFSSWATIEQPPIVDWKNTHPILRYVNFDTVLIREAFKVPAPAWAFSLVDSPQAPLIIAGELNKRRIIWIAFDVTDSNWPLRFSFPIFIANAVDWLNPFAERNSQLVVRAGDPFRVQFEEDLKEVIVIFPDGSQKVEKVEPGKKEMVFGETMKAGLYQVKAGAAGSFFTVNLLDQVESNITPADSLKFGKYTFAEATTLKRANMEIWRWIALGAFLILMVEWWYYHRRTV